MKKLAAIFGGLLTLLVLAALVAPFFIDLNDWKPEISAKVKSATGRELKIDGDISLFLLPLPGIRVEGVHFGNAQGASRPDMATLQSVSVKVALAPLFGGKIQVEEIVLTKPDLILEKLPDGSGNWELTGSTPQQDETQSAQGGGLDIAIGSAIIESGALTYRDAAAGVEQKVEDINATLRLDSLQGPFDVEGGLIALGMPLGFSVKTGRIESERPIAVDLALKLTEANADLSFSGQADARALNDPAQNLASGRLSAKGESLAKLLAALPGGSTESLPPIASQAFSLEGQVKAGAVSGQVENLTATLGELTAKAGVAASYEHELAVQANIALARLDLDALMPSAAGEGDAGKPQASSAFALPSGITAGADIFVQQIAYRGQAIDDAHVVFQLTDGQVQISKASAKLPGSSAGELSGVLAVEGGQPSFVGAVKLDSDNLRALIDAFAPGAVASVPADRLRQLAFTSRLAYSPSRAELADIAASLDQSKAAGGIVLALPDGVQRTKLGFGVGLSVDKINLDGYLPKKTGEEQTTSPSSANPLAALAPLADLDANVELRAGSLTLNEQQVNGLHLLASIAEGKMEIKDLSVTDFLGGKGAVAATIVDLAGDPQYDAKFDVTAKEAARVLRMAGMNPPEGGKLGALSLKGSAAGNWQNVDYDVTLGMAGIGLQGAAKGKARGLDAGVPKIDTTFDLKAKDVSLLAAMAGVPAATAKQIGAVAAKGVAASGADDVAYDMTLSMSGIGLQGSVKGRAQGLSAKVPRIDATFDLKTKNIAPIAALAGMPADAAKELGAVAAQGKAQSGADEISYDVTLSLAGVSGGGTLKGKVTQLAGEPQVDTAIDLKADQPAPLLRMAGLAGPKAKAVGPLAIKGTLKGGMNDMALDLALAALGGSARINGNVQAKALPIAFNVAMSADHPEFSELARIADLPSSGEAAGPVKLRATASGTTQIATIQGLDAAWGKSRIQGEARYDATGARPLVVANLSGGVVDLRPFMAPKKEVKTASSGSPWSEEPLDLSLIKENDADIDFAARSLLTADQRIDDLVAKISIRSGRMSINTLQGRIYGGAFDLSGSEVVAAATPTIRAKAAIQNIQMSEFLGGGIAGNQVKGPLSFNLDANGIGASEAEIVRSLRGTGDVGGTIMIIGKVERTIGATLLTVLGKNVKQVEGLTNIVNGVLTSFTGVDNTVSGTFAMNKGILATKDFSFVNPNARGAARGRVDLGTWALKLLIDLFGSDAQQAFMSLNLTGPVDSPNVAFAPGAAAGPTGILGLAPNGQLTPNNLLRQIPGVGNILGKQPTTQQPVQPLQPDQVLEPGVLQAPQTKPSGVLQQLLGTQGTTKKKKKQTEPLLQPAPEPQAAPQPAPAPGVFEPGAALQPLPADAQPEPAPLKPEPEPQTTAPQPEPAPAAVEPGSVLEPLPAEAQPEPAPLEPAPETKIEPAAEPGVLLPAPSDQSQSEPGALPPSP